LQVARNIVAAPQRLGRLSIGLWWRMISRAAQRSPQSRRGTQPKRGKSRTVEAARDLEDNAPATALGAEEDDAADDASSGDDDDAKSDAGHDASPADEFAELVDRDEE
jgi:hypothetical protein